MDPSIDTVAQGKLDTPDAKPRISLDQAEALIFDAGGSVQTAMGDQPTDLPIVHTFTPGLYSRTIFMPGGAVLTSKIHKTEHQFIVSQGAVWVYSDNDGPQLIQAPHHGITKPGTRRLLVVEKDTLWTTFHATDLTDVEEIERAIIEPHMNPLLPENVRQQLSGGSK